MRVSLLGSSLSGDFSKTTSIPVGSLKWRSIFIDPLQIKGGFGQKARPLHGECSVMEPDGIPSGCNRYIITEASYDKKIIALNNSGNNNILSFVYILYPMSAAILFFAICLVSHQAGAVRPTQAIDGIISKPSAEKSKKPFSSPSGIFIQARAYMLTGSHLIASSSRENRAVAGARLQAAPGTRAALLLRCAHQLGGDPQDARR